MKHGLTAGAAFRVANRARRNTPRLRLPLTYSQRHGEELGAPVLPQYDKERETILLKLVGALERQTNRGQTDDNITAIVNQWAGKLSGQLSVVSYQRKTKTLRLQAKHPAIIMELRPRLAALKLALKGTGITEVKL